MICETDITREYKQLLIEYSVLCKETIRGARVDFVRKKLLQLELKLSAKDIIRLTKEAM